MKNIFSKKSFIAISAIIIAGALFFGLPAICSSMDGGMGGGPCGLQRTVRSDTSYVNIPILNNHHPKTETITKVYMAVPAATPCYTSGMNCLSETRVKEIKFGDTIAFNASSSWCCCIGSTRHSDGHLYTLDTNYSFSGAKVSCRVALDVLTAPSGNYTVTYYYTLPDDATVRSNELAFTIP
ncbi:MAG: hypothetical protein KKI12_05260 [Proteobacteria bacterium]|nr:hypothetical protein [Pseudomonadota bacterium]